MGARAVYLEFPTERQAFVFERYLKSGSGRAFAKRHFDGDARWHSAGHRARCRPDQRDMMKILS